MFFKRSRGHGVWLKLFAAIVSLVLSTAVNSTRAEAPPTQAVEAGQVITQLAETLAAGRSDTIKHLDRLGFEAETQRMRNIDGTQLHTFSSRSMIESLYRRADLQMAGEGNRFLAVLYNDARKNSIGMDKDPAFADLRRFSSDDLKKPILFADPAVLRGSAARPSLPDAVENAIGKLSEFYSGRNLAQARGLIRRFLKKPGFEKDFTRKFDAAVAEEKTALAVLRRLFQEGTPPPRIENALFDMMRETMTKSAALQFDPAALQVMDELSRELPPELDRYVQFEDQFESRKHQAAEATRTGRPGKDAVLAEGDVLARMDRAITGLSVSSQSPLTNTGKGPPPKSSEPATSQPPPFDPPPPAAAAADPDYPKGSGGGGGGGAPPARAQAEASGKAYAKYTGSTFGPQPGSGPATTSPSVGPSPTPRSYRAAIRSARAARGIAVGGKVKSEVTTKPLRAAWVANLKDERFGRIFVEFTPENGSQVIAASRVLFADSFYSAVDLLSDKHDGEARFREDEILVLMSMDPDSPITKDAFAKFRDKVEATKKLATEEARAAGQKLQKDAAALLERFENARTPSERSRVLAEVSALEQRKEAQEQLLKEHVQAWTKELAKSEASIPRGIVVHPGINGRELAWSAARVDFWFNQMPALANEASRMNGGQAMPASLRKITFAGAATWQFYERDSVIRLESSNAKARSLVVASKTGDQENTRSHFGISMFGGSPPDFEQLPKLESEVEPLLDWLAVNHHDYMRLNDLSEAFSLLRWLGSTKTPITVIDMDGQGPALATPDRVIIGTGPGVAP
jgi:hypothetical protein